MTRRMADSITPSDIPVNDPQTGRPWALVAGYIDGLYAWSRVGWARFPQSRHVRIAVFSSTDDGDVIDRETGDATADQAVDWVLLRRAAGHPNPVVYCSYFNWGACQNAFLARGVAMPAFWISGYPSPTDPAGNPVIPVGALAHQFTDIPRDNTGQAIPGAHWDESIVVDYWAGVDPAPHNDIVGDDDMTAAPALFMAAGVPNVNGGNPLFPHGVWRNEFGVCTVLNSDNDRTDLVAAFTTAVTGPNAGGVWLEQATLADMVHASRVGIDSSKLVNVTGVAVSGGTMTVSVPGSWKVTDIGSGVTTVVAQQ